MVSSLLEVKWINLSTITDSRGCLTAIESSLDIPIEIKRIFYMHNIVAGRGGHAHIDTDQVIVAINGTFTVMLSDSETRQVYKFNTAEKGLYVPRLTFTDLYDFSPDAVCLVLANTHYNMGMSLRTWDDYISYLKKNNI
jgi:hypothetical protein